MKEESWTDISYSGIYCWIIIFHLCEIKFNFFFLLPLFLRSDASSYLSPVVVVVFVVSGGEVVSVVSVKLLINKFIQKETHYLSLKDYILYITSLFHLFVINHKYGNSGYVCKENNIIRSYNIVNVFDLS